MEKIEMKNSSRRNFLRTAPVAAAAGIAIADAALFTATTEGQSVVPVVPAAFHLFTARSIQDDIKALQAGGNNNLVDAKTMPCPVVLTTEAAKSAKEFEWHEGRDHLVQILEGSTVYEVGGAPKDGRNIKPGEWLAPAAEGAATLTLRKGDMLVIPRGTLHKRSTAESVTFLLISPMGSVKP
jgi:mannose-6-phosphate isomerase-like protein (cupin superfamily)